MHNRTQIQRFTILWIFLLGLILIGGFTATAMQRAYSQGTIAEIPKTETAPVIDGGIDNIWLGAPSYAITTIVTGGLSVAPEDFSGTFRGLYDNETLYLLVEVRDDAYVSETGNFWEDDLIEIYLDGNRSRGSVYDGVDDFHYLFRWDDPVDHRADGSINVTTAIERAMAKTNIGYLLEFAVPLAAVGLPSTSGYEFGLDVHMIDDDDGGPRDHKKTWHAATDNAWADPSLFGTGRLSSFVVTPTSTPTSTPTATPTSTPTSPPGQADDCSRAPTISTDGTPQLHHFASTTAVDWFRFDATGGVIYRIEVSIPDDSAADVVLELHGDCDSLPLDLWNETFTPGVRLDFSPMATAPIFLRLSNQNSAAGSDQLRYQLTVRPLRTEPNSGAVIIVAGRLRASDPLQRNIHNVTDRVNRIFLAQGYTNETIYYLATDSTRPGYDAAATKENLRNAITQWATQRVGADQSLTLYLIDHGDRNRFYLDGANSITLTPQELDSWLATFEAAVPSAKVNLIIEACYIGSFIQGPETVSKPGRVVITSSDSAWSAYASRDGAHFSDHFLTALQQGQNLFTSFDAAQRYVNQTVHYQNPWIDANGNSIPNEQADFALAAQRGFAYAGTLDTDSWPPYIVRATGPATVTERRGLLTAEVRDDTNVESVWAVVYAPSYVPPTSDEELLGETAPTLLLTPQGNDRYAVEYPGFDEVGDYRIIFNAKDNAGNLAQPQVVTVTVGTQLYLPLVTR